MDDDKKFGLLHETLKDIFKFYYENVMRTLAFIFIVIGWLITSIEARGIISTDSTLKIILLLVIVIGGVVHARASYLFYQHSQNTIQSLKELNIVPIKYYEQSQITRYMFLANLALNLALLIILFAMVLSQ